MAFSICQPVAEIDRQQPGGILDDWRQAGDAIADNLVGAAFLLTGAIPIVLVLQGETNVTNILWVLGVLRQEELVAG